MNENEFTTRVAIVSGASSGIGRSTAVMLAARGARVVAFARSEAKLREIHRDGLLHAVVADAANEADVERVFSECERLFGPCDLLVNNAGMVDPARLVDTSHERFMKMFEVNVGSVHLAARRALPSMLERGRGDIVSVASISGVAGPEKFPGFVSYCASKAAVIAFTEALAVEVRDRGVRVNCVSPGSVDTPMWAGVSGGAPASMTPDEIAETILFLASARSRPMNGQNLDVYST